MRAPAEPLVRPTRAEAFRFWTKLGFASFGGSPAQIALMHAELVVRRRWLDEEGFRHDMALCHSLPGPEGQQLAVLSAMRLHGPAAGFFAGAAFVVPGALLVLLASLLLPGPERPEFAPLWGGLRIGALALLAPSAWKMLRRDLRPAVLALAFFGASASIAGVPLPLIVVIAGVVGFFIFRKKSPAHTHDEPAGSAFPGRHLVTTTALIFIPAIIAALAFGWSHTIAHVGRIALRIGFVGFGGAYAVLPETFRLFGQCGTLPPGLMADATTVGEAAPGPFLLAVQYGAFATAAAFPGNLSPVAAGVIGAMLASWCLFATSTSLVILVAPVADRWAKRPGVNAALTGIGAAATGQIAGLVVPVAIAATPATGDLRWKAALLLAAGLVFVIRQPARAFLVVPLCGLFGWFFVHQ